VPENQKPDLPPQDLPRPETGAPARDAAKSSDVLRLGLRVEEFERRLKARTLELETEIRAKERLRARVTELTKRADELQETAAALHREAVSATALSQELDETLRVASEARRQLGDALNAERARREAAEKDLAADRPALEDALARAARAEEALAAATETRARAESTGKALAGVELELKRREAELKDARLHLQALRQKSDGHEAHIDSLRSELEAAREQAAGRAEVEERARRAEEAAVKAASRAKEVSVEAAMARAARGELESRLRDLEKTSAETTAALAQVRAARDEAERARAASEEARVAAAKDAENSLAEIERQKSDLARERFSLETELSQVRAKSREVLENAEAIRHEGVEAFENTREMKIRLELEAEQHRRERAESKRLEAEREKVLRDELESLKEELRDRAEREGRELRDALEAERKRLYQDLDAERGAGRASTSDGEAAEERVRRVRTESQERRRGIEREVESYLTPAPAELPLPSVVPEADASIVEMNPPRASAGSPTPVPWQKRDEMRLFVWVMGGACLVAAVVAAILFFQG
jgi:chromosome segregation ATPase